MEVSTITTGANANTANNLQTEAPQVTVTATMTTTAVTTTINTNNIITQISSNDNLQSQTQKSLIPTINSCPVKPPIVEQIISNNNSNCNNRNQSLTAPPKGSCYAVNKQYNAPMTPTQAHIAEHRGSNSYNYEQSLDQALQRDVKLTIEALLHSLDSSSEIVVTATTSQSSLICAEDELCTTTAVIEPVVEEEDDQTKDIVTLRNLEITPPPQPEGSIETPEPPQLSDQARSGAKRKSSRVSSEPSEITNTRSKRQRTQTKLFQVEVKDTAKSKQPRSVQKDKSNSIRKESASARKTPAKAQPVQSPQQPKPTHVGQDFQDVIFYEKNDYLAIRNEENSFYLCQLTEHVRVPRPFVKVKWLDTDNNGETYRITSHYDKVPQKSIIMPVTLRKLKNDRKGPQTYALDDDIRDSVMERLKRSLNVPVAEIE